jgi:peptidoglycan-N-acetylglucosamine deacetylase
MHSASNSTRIRNWVRLLIELLMAITILVLVTERYTAPPIHTPRVVFSAPTRQKLVALTYDDGPHPVFTPQIVKTLTKYHVRATFFMVGKRMEEHPDIVRQVLSGGNVIGNHTYTHPHDIALDTDAQVIRELDKCEEVIERLTGKRAMLFRPPLGLSDAAVLQVAGEEGYRTILWTVSADHHDAPTPQAMAKRVLRRIRPGAIILAHDGSYPMRWKDVAATPLIIEGLRKKGYKFVTVPELLNTSR